MRPLGDLADEKKAQQLLSRKLCDNLRIDYRRNHGVCFAPETRRDVKLKGLDRFF